MIPPPDRLTLRPPGLSDEAVCLAAQASLTDYPFLLLWDEQMAWSDYVELLAGLRDGTAVPGDFVPSTFLIAEAADHVVGRLSVRFELNEFLAAEGGHIGYAVLPAHRRRGYATELLRRAVAIAHDHGIARLLVCCDDDNAASARVIERCGGSLESVIAAESHDGSPLRRYWIGGRESPS